MGKLKDWRSRKRSTQADMAAFRAVILDIVKERAPITVRGVAYALFVRGLIPSMETKHTAKVSKVMTAMREDETLDWTLVVDGSRLVSRPDTWSDPGASIEATVKDYRRDNWQDQPTFVEVWSEKGTVEGILQPVLDELGATFRVMKGFGSFTTVKQAATDSQIDLDNGQKTVALYVGDWDPSGLWMSERDLPERLVRYGGQHKLKRIGIVKTDTARLPHFDVATKAGDARYKWFVAKYGRRCWELDAMDPNVLRDRVRKAIVSYIDQPLWQQSLKIEAAEVESMRFYHESMKTLLSRRR
jgi:hypothetical protein